MLGNLARAGATVAVAVIALNACSGSRTHTAPRSSPARNETSTAGRGSGPTGPPAAASTAVHLSGALTNTTGDNYRLSISGDLGTPQESVTRDASGFAAVESPFVHSAWTVENQRVDRSAPFDQSHFVTGPIVLYAVYPAGSRACAAGLYVASVRSGPAAVPRTGQFCDVPIARVSEDDHSQPAGNRIPPGGSRAGPMLSYQAPERGSVEYLPGIPKSEIGPILDDMRARPPAGYAVIVLHGGRPFGELPAPCDLPSVDQAHDRNALVSPDELLFTASSASDGAMVQHTC